MRILHPLPYLLIPWISVPPTDVIFLRPFGGIHSSVTNFIREPLTDRRYRMVDVFLYVVCGCSFVSRGHPRLSLICEFLNNTFLSLNCEVEVSLPNLPKLNWQRAYKGCMTLPIGVCLNFSYAESVVEWR